MLEVPVYRLIGGKTNSRVRVYNTCFPPLYDFMKEPEKIARELEADGIKPQVREDPAAVQQSSNL